MPLSAKQRKVIDEGQAACANCGAWAARLRQAGHPNEALEERQSANAKFWESVKEAIAELDSEPPVRKKSAT